MTFRNEFWFLSNMFPCKLSVKIGSENLTFTCSEAVFQGLKCPERIHEFVGLNGFEAKKLGKLVRLRPDWYDIQVSLMRDICQAKFDQNPWLKTKLAEIKTEIVENNTWGDTFWGVCNGQGQNQLGKILMEIRDSL